MKAINYMDKVLSKQGYVKNENNYIYECEDYVHIVSYQDGYKTIFKGNEITKLPRVKIRCYDKNVESDDFNEYVVNENSNVELKIIFKQFGII